MQQIVINDFSELACGENLIQKANISPIENGIEYEVLSENSLEYIDWLNLSKVITIVAEFFDVHTCAIVRENMILSVALGSSNETALQKCIDTNPLSITDSTVGFTKEVTLEVARQISTMKVRNVVSSKFSKEALGYLQDRDINIVQIKNSLQELLGQTAFELRTTPFGYLSQEKNMSKLTKSSFKVVSKAKPTQQMAEDAIFAWKVAKYTNSNSFVVAKDLATVAIVQNQVSEVEGIEKAIDIACENSKEAVLALDSVIENENSLNPIIQGRIGLVIEAGNSVNSEKVLDLANKYELSIIHTGIRNYKY